MTTPAKILGVDEDATLDQIHAAFRRKASQNHPDLGGDKAAFQAINSAYQKLLRLRDLDEQKQKARAAAFAEQKRKDAEATANSAFKSATQESKSKERRTKSSHSDSRHGKPKRNSRPARKTRTEVRNEQRKQRESAAVEPKPETSKSFFTRNLPLQSETCFFILANVLDIFLTDRIIKLGGVEANPIARYFIDLAGYGGMIAFKLTIVAIVCIIAQVIATRNLKSAQRLLIFGTLVVTAVVIYSLVLIRKNFPEMLNSITG